MKKVLALTIIGGLICLQFAGSVRADALSDGKEIFSRICARCHGSEGQGQPAPALQGKSSAEVLQKLQGYLAGTYGGGRKATMENMVKQRTQEELRSVAEYVGTLKL